MSGNDCNDCFGFHWKFSDLFSASGGQMTNHFKIQFKRWKYVFIKGKYKYKCAK